MKYFVTDDGKYRIESLTPPTIPGALRVMKEALFRHENVSIGSEVNKNPEAIEELLELCANSALDGVSLVAVVVDTGEVAAAIFNEIKVKTSDEKSFFEMFVNERCKHASSHSLVCDLWPMSTQNATCLKCKYDVDYSFELMFLATLQEYRRQKLGTLLFKYSIEVARKIIGGSIVPISVADLGPKYSHMKNRKFNDTYPKICQAMCTVNATQKIARRLNLKVHLTVSYSEFEFNGKTYSERIGDETAVCQIFALRL